MISISILTKEDAKKIVKESVGKELSDIYKELHRQRIRIIDLEQIMKNYKGRLI